MFRFISAIKTITPKIPLPTTAIAGFQRTSASVGSIVELRQKVLYSTKVENKMGDDAATIAIGQMRSTNDKQSNRDQVQEIVKLAVQQKASVCILNSLTSRAPAHRSK